MFFGKIKRAITHVLVVEDEPLVAFDNEHALAGAGYTVAGTVDSYAEAERVIDHHKVDLVITDIRLSGERSGIDVAQLAYDRNTPVLFVTGHCPAEARHLAMGCLSKPYAPRDLLLAIDAVDCMLRGDKMPRLPVSLSLFGDKGNGQSLL